MKLKLSVPSYKVTGKINKLTDIREVINTAQKSTFYSLLARNSDKSGLKTSHRLGYAYLWSRKCIGFADL